MCCLLLASCDLLVKLMLHHRILKTCFFSIVIQNKIVITNQKIHTIGISIIFCRIKLKPHILWVMGQDSMWSICFHVVWSSVTENKEMYSFYLSAALHIRFRAWTDGFNHGFLTQTFFYLSWDKFIQSVHQILAESINVFFMSSSH